MKPDYRWDPELMIRRASSLARVAEEINKNGNKGGPGDDLLLEGQILVEAVLLSLGAEIALKAWQCRERSGAPDHTHDLLKLFVGLGEKAQKRLEEKMPEVGNPVRGLPPIYPGMRNALTRCSSVFLERRYVHEHESLYAETGVLKTALKAIVEAYEDSAQIAAAAE